MFWSRFWLMRRVGSSPMGLVASASWRLALRRWGLLEEHSCSKSTLRVSDAPRLEEIASSPFGLPRNDSSGD